jgi:hypothetical protein
MPHLLEIARPFEQIFALYSTLMAIVIIASSIIQYSNDSGRRSETHHRCALELKELTRKYVFGSNSKNCDQIIDDYCRILKTYPINHLPTDYISMSQRIGKSTHTMAEPKDLSFG